MVKCVAVAMGTPEKNQTRMNSFVHHSFGIDSLFFLTHSHSHSLSIQSDTRMKEEKRKTANDSNIQHQFQNEPNEFLCDDFFLCPFLCLALSLCVYRVQKGSFIHIVHVPCIQLSVCSPLYPISTYRFHSENLYTNYHFVYVIHFFSAAVSFCVFSLTCFPSQFTGVCVCLWILSTVYLLECEC